jgi:hypothetical protein
MQLKLPLEKSGWRTLVDIIKNGKIPMSNVYGRNGRLGKAISELEHRGIVEIRYFKGERGRGGNILRLRISYEKEPIKRHIDNKIMGTNKNI